MILPTRAAALAAAAGMPVALVVAVVLPARWFVALAWPLAVLVLVGVDAVLAPRRGRATLMLPETAPVGGVADARIEVRIEGRARSAEVAVAADPLVEAADDGRQRVPLVDGRGVAVIALATLRRGTARIARVWLRWRGPLGLVWRAQSEAVAAELPILPDIRPVHERGALLFRRHALEGLIAQLERGEGTEFETLAEYRPGMDRRSIDWKQSARHVKLYAKQFRPERNNQVVLAIDASRQMSEPVAGVPRVDRAVSAALLLAWIALKLGDRVSLESFDERPRLRTGFVGGVRAFGMLQHRAAAIDYSGAESNYTFALADLAARLTRRSTVVLFTEFTDLVASDFLVRATAQLIAGHLLIVVVLADEELEAVLSHPPEEAADVTRAVTAAGLLRDRLLVLTRLRHLGVHVVEAPHDQLGERLVAVYAELKRRGLL